MGELLWKAIRLPEWRKAIYNFPHYTTLMSQGQLRLTHHRIHSDPRVRGPFAPLI